SPAPTCARKSRPRVLFRSHPVQQRSALVPARYSTKLLRHPCALERDGAHPARERLHHPACPFECREDRGGCERWLNPVWIVWPAEIIPRRRHCAVAQRAEDRRSRAPDSHQESAEEPTAVRFRPAADYRRRATGRHRAAGCHLSPGPQLKATSESKGRGNKLSLRSAA